MDANTASNMGVHGNAASAVLTVLVQNATPTAVLAAQSNPGGANGANIVTATFNQQVQALSSNNSGNEFIVIGCTTAAPTVSGVVMSTNGGGDSVATVTLGGGTCISGDTVSISLDTSLVTNLAGDTGTVNPTPETYGVP